MFKKAILSLGAALSICSIAHAQVTQPCSTDEHHKQQVSRYPGIKTTEAALEKDIKKYVEYQMFGWREDVAAKGTSHWDSASGYWNIQDQQQYHIPVVVHIIHAYGNEYINDNRVYDLIKNLNVYYNKRNADTASVIAPFKKYIGNPRFTFHLANKDPQGNPTTGITRHYSYLTAGGDEYAKLDQWPANRYLNIWIETRIGRGIQGGIIAAYSRFPADGYNNPYGDGIIANYSFINGTDLTMPHEVGHYFNLLHVWNNNQAEACLGLSCGDDAVDDTPPTLGHFSGNCPGKGCVLYDTTCSIGYEKSYKYSSPKAYDSTVTKTVNGVTTTDTFWKTTAVTIDFPDTNNTQNIMDYSDCTNMFTIGQVMRMRATMTSTESNRSNLATPSNLFFTGAWSDTTGTIASQNDLKTIPDFSVNRNFVCSSAAGGVTFTNRSWRDTVTAAEWTFPGANPSTSTSTSTINVNSFTTTGWYSATLKSTSRVGGVSVDSSITKSNVLYIADPNAVDASGYYQDFVTGSGSDVDQFPIFNYFAHNDYKWELSSVGYYDNSSITFRNFDTRSFVTEATKYATPQGLYADFYTRAFNITGSEFANKAALTFYSAGAFRSANPLYQNDSLIISYSVDCGVTWLRLGKLDKANLGNNGELSVPFYPLSMNDWKLSALTLPAAARTNKVFFRFRYYAGVDNGAAFGYNWGSGNHFYLDRINITGNNVGVDDVAFNNKGIVVVPNPTNSAATLKIKGGDNSDVVVNITDVTGKVVYTTNAKLSQTITTVEIPAEKIAVKGMYMVQVAGKGSVETQKLVVY